MTQTLSILASVFTLISVGSYFKQLIKGESIPNPATWLIWLVVTIVNTATYFLLVDKDIWVSLTSMVLAIGILFIFVFALIKGKFSKLGKIEIISLMLVLVIGIFWQVSNDPKIANVALQAVFLISFLPTIIGLLNDTLKDRPLPWFAASTSYTFQIVIVLINFSTVGFAGLAFPIINLIGNGTVGLIALKKEI